MTSASWARPAAPASVPELRSHVVTFATEHGIREPEIGTLALAASEALTNAVVHAFPDGAEGGTVTAGITLDDERGRVTLDVSDDGQGMTLRPDAPGFGPGLQLIARTAAAFDVRPGPRGMGTQVSMTFDVPLRGTREHPGLERRTGTDRRVGEGADHEPGAARVDGTPAAGTPKVTDGPQPERLALAGDDPVLAPDEALGLASALASAAAVADGAAAPPAGALVPPVLLPPTDVEPLRTPDGEPPARADARPPAWPPGQVDVAPISSAPPGRMSERLVVSLVALGLLAWAVAIVLLVRLL